MLSFFKIKNCFLLFLVSLILLATACQDNPAKEPTAQKQTEPQWNVVFILADDLGWNQVGYHGTPFYETPNIDKIAREGIYFTRAYSANPVCSPTRASIMTGKNPARLGITDYIPGSPYPYARLNRSGEIPGLPLEEVTLAEMLKSKGYTTGHFGKWHLNIDKNYQAGRPGDPASQGFDEVLTTVKPPPDADPEKDAHHTIEITNRSLDFLDRQHDKPFFLYTSYHAVHRPLMEKADLIAKYQAKPNSNDPVNNPIMGAMIERMDTGIGQILAKLKQYHIEDKTIVIFYSDNGGFEQLQDQAPLRGGKAMVFEGGIKVPLAMKWPGVIKAGSVSNEYVLSDDFFPTLAAIVEYEYDATKLDGHSLLPILKKKGRLNRNQIAFHYPHYHHLGYQPGGAIHVGDYKLIEWFEASAIGESRAVELFNLKEDVGETTDLARRMPEKTQELLNALHQWQKSVNAQMMTTNPNFEKAKEDWRFVDRRE